MDSSDSPAPPDLGGGGRQDEDQDMTDAPPQYAAYTKSQFLPPSSAGGSPEAANDTVDYPEQAPVLESTEKPAISGKKKGQASVKKAPKRGRGGVAGGTKPGRKKSKKAAPPEGGDDGAEAADSDDESDNGPYCICRGPDDHRFMIGCDLCEDWFHGECVGIDKDVGENLIDRFVCPNCTKEDTGVSTVFKKTCSLPKCKKPARLYGDQDKSKRSHFCCNEHSQQWWERAIATLPKKAGPGGKVPASLTQQQAVAILESGIISTTNSESNRINNEPNATANDGKSDEKPTTMDIQDKAENGGRLKTENESDPSGRDHDDYLTPEQKEIIAVSEAERKKIGHESILYMQMQTVVEWVSLRRKTLVAAKQLDEAACGYDTRLDSVGAAAPFEHWLNSEDGLALFEGYSMGQGVKALGRNIPLTVDPDYTCDRKRCKTHQGWYAIHIRDLKLHIKQLNAECHKRVEREIEIRRSALRKTARLARDTSGH